MSKVSRIYVSLTFLFLTLFIPLVLFIEWAYTPDNHLKEDVIYYIAEGSSSNEITNALANRDAILHPKLFKFYIKIMGVEKSIKPGTFIFTSAHSPSDILKKIVDGDSLKVKILIPEGLNIYQISQKLADTFPQYDLKYWENLMSDSSLISLLPLDGDDSPPKNIEGFLFPDTYFFDPNQKPIHILQSFIEHFKQSVTPQMRKQARTLNLSTFEYVTLASIVQKETAIDEELNEISSVFLNRLRIRMKLQSDPTVIYGMWNNYKGKITKKHLRTRTQYNTYTNYGLPIGPVSNPGLAALRAVINPTQSNNLYFVATGNGAHKFSETYKSHKQAVKEYLKYLRTYAN